MAEVLQLITSPEHPDDIKGAGILFVGYGVAGFAGASAGAAISKLDGATNNWNETQPSQEVPSTMVAVNHNLVTGGEVFGPIALGTVAGLALWRRFVKAF